MNTSTHLYGPISQVVTMGGLPGKGTIRDEALEIIGEGGIVVRDGKITHIGRFGDLKNEGKLHEFEQPCVLLPGFVDAHTHLCFAGSRANDYSRRISGSTYEEILAQGGGIYDTVEKTRQCGEKELLDLTLRRLDRHMREGVTTCEVKSGYGLSAESELKMLRVIRQANEAHPVSVIPTCLAAHVPAKEFSDAEQYLQHLQSELLPAIRKESLTSRIDIFVESSAFTPALAARYLEKVQAMGFNITVHADQFTRGGSAVAVKFNARSADHLEASGDEEIRALARSATTATVLPGASIGLGMNFAPARKLLDGGCRVAIASDWNPGSAPMGDLLLQASLISAYEKLSNAETLAGITVRAAEALGLHDRGQLAAGMRADFITFPVTDFREILYYQGKLNPSRVWIGGKEVT